MTYLNRLAAWACVLSVLLVGGALLPAAVHEAPARFVPTLFAQPSAASVRLTAPYRVTVGAAAVQLTASGNVHGIVVKALSPGQTVYIGASSAVTTATGYPMVDGETLTLEVRNADQLYAIASAASQAVAVLPFSRY
jgi:hypothetical protein